MKAKIYLLLIIIFIGCNNKEYDAKENVLIPIVDYYIEQEEYKMSNIDSLYRVWNGIPIRIEIFQKKDYKNCFQFAVLLSNSNISYMKRLPTKIVKIKNRYVFMYMQAKQPLSRRHLPRELFKTVKGDLLDETSWQILMCKKCLRCVVVMDKEIIPIEYIKQFNEFTCDCRCDYRKNIQEIIVEDAIIDTEDGILPPPPLLQIIP